MSCLSGCAFIYSLKSSLNEKYQINKNYICIHVTSIEAFWIGTKNLLIIVVHSILPQRVWPTCVIAKCYTGLCLK